MEEIALFGEWIERISLWLKAVFVTLKKSKFNRLMGLQPNVACEMIVPIRYGILKQQFIGCKEFKLTNEFKYITFDEGRAIMELSRIMPKTEFVLIQDMAAMQSTNNKICIGSMLANDYTIQFFKGLTGVKLIGKFMRGSSKATLQQKELKPVAEFLTERKEKHALYFSSAEDANNVIEYPYDPSGDYLVWIKVCAKDYGEKRHGTVHLLFGDKSDTAILGIKFIASHCDELYKKLKQNGHLQHHFVVLERSPTHEISLSSMCDFTDIMLRN